eukprot:TRINITY_DN19239_c0_g2_i2.p1 TRINITY_DN19239_c0_g2~~TRINITY_DN19239_c0_g2_i2.p1  ORF type:complete len:533 (+),score=134.21 TRINITY_DN19239_c0_g2_i2:441-2039(+)
MQLLKDPQLVEAEIVFPTDGGLPVVPVQLPMMDGAWVWIRQKNEEIHRATRLDSGRLLRETFRRGGFCWRQNGGPKHVVKYRYIPKMVKGTRIFSCKHGLPPLRRDPKRSMEMEYGSCISPIEKAETMALGVFRPAVVNAASAYHAGGGFTSGGRHALEEAFCSQTTLYASLEHAIGQFQKGLAKKLYTNDQPNYHQHIPTDGCIMSPYVEIVRGGTDQGYLAHATAVPVASVISMAMYNKNTGVRDAPVDAPSDQTAYEEGVRKKFTAAIHAAAFSEADALILPDVGCGVFRNDAATCGRIAGTVLYEFRTRFKRTVFTGKKEFYEAAVAAMKACGDAPPPPLSLEASTRASSSLEDTSHLSVGVCVICGKNISGCGFSSLALLIDKKHKSHRMQFLHESCTKDAPKKFPKHQVLTLPRITVSAESFLKALDLNGNGLVEKQELRCLCAILWDGDLSLEAQAKAFERDFDEKWERWDATHSGNVSLQEIKGTVSPSGGAKRKSASLAIEGMPQSLIEWFQEQSRRCEAKSR